MDYHHDQIEANIPELGGMVVTSLQEIIQLNSLVAAFRRSALVVHQPPFIAFPRWRGIETDVGLHGDSAGSDWWFGEYHSGGPCLWSSEYHGGGSGL